METVHIPYKQSVQVALSEGLILSYIAKCVIAMEIMADKSEQADLSAI